MPTQSYLNGEMSRECGRTDSEQVQEGRTVNRMKASAFFTNDMAAATSKGKGMNRRNVLKMMGGIGAVVLATGVTGNFERVGAQSSTVDQLKTSAALNFHIGPSATAKVIKVLPKGSIVAATGTHEGKWMEVGHSGTYGWVHIDYLVPVSVTTDPDLNGVAWTTSAVNLRTSPSTSNKVLRVVPSGARVATSATVQNGFRYVSVDGLAGWMADQYLTTQNDDQGGNYRTTMAAVNLRAEPSVTSKVLTVIPAGATIQLLHTGVGKYGNANYRNMQGWVHLDYVK